MNVYFSLLIYCFLIFSIFCVIPQWNLLNIGEKLSDSLPYEYSLIHRSMYNVELEMTRKILIEDGKLTYKNYLKVNYYGNNELYKEVPFDFVESFYYINDNYIICPKGAHHPYNLNTGKYIKIPFEKKGIQDWDMRCYKHENNGLTFFLVFYLMNGEKNLFYTTYGEYSWGEMPTFSEELYDYKLESNYYYNNLERQYPIMSLMKNGENLTLIGKVIYLKNDGKNQYIPPDSEYEKIESINRYTQAYFDNYTNSFYYITYDNVDNFLSGYVITTNTDRKVNGYDWAKVTHNNITPFEFIDEVEIEEMNFMLYNKFVYYKIKDKNNNKIYHGVLDVIMNKVIFNTDEEINYFLPFSSNAMLAITPTAAYKICLYKSNGECVEDCDKYNLDIDGNKCGSSSDCPENKKMLMPNKICIESCDNTYLIEKEGQCGLCKDLFPEEKPYKLINGTECMAEYEKKSMEFINENLKILKCKSGFKFENNECISDKKCHQNCLSCDEYSEDIEHQKCTSCIDGLYLEGENCKENCSEGYGKNEEDKTCIKCEYDLCESFISNTCDCEKCIGKYFLNSSNLCSSCDESCEECIDVFDKCTKCDNNHFLFENKCYNCPNNCSKTEQDSCKCLKCDKGFYVEKYICKNCINNCDECSDSTKCENCKEGFFVDDEGICKDCPLNCNKTEPDSCKCLKCDKGFYVENYICKNCLANCDTCSNSTKCENCEEGYFVNDEDTCQSCSSNCKKTEADSCKCSECDKGFHVDKYICKNCIINCDTCSNSTKCENCKEGYFVNENGQCQSCPLNCKTKDIDGCQCKICIDEYFLKNKDCEKCDTNCKTCIDESTHCTSCESDNYFINNENKCQECLKDCKTCSKVDSNCTSCEDKKYLNKENKCEACSEVCGTCSSGKTDGNDNCDSCNINSEYKYLIEDTNNKTCVKNCTELGRDFIEGNKCGPKKNNSVPVTPDNNNPNGDESEKNGTDYLIWIFVAIIAIFLIVITICIVKKCCYNKDSNSFYDDITNELDEKEIIN